MNEITFVIDGDKIPGSFDFLWLIQNCLSYAEINNFSKTYIMFDDSKGYDFHGHGNEVFLNAINRPLLKMFGLEEVKEIVGTELRNMPFNNSGIVSYYNRTQKGPFPWDVEDYAKEWAEQYRDTIIMTLRQCEHFPQRNSNLPEWVKAAEVLTKQGNRVIFVPDTWDLHPDVGGYECLSIAALDIQKRAALCKVAKANLFNANGPGTLCTCTKDLPYLIVVPTIAVEQFECANAHMLSRIRFDFNHINSFSASPWTIFLGLEKGDRGFTYSGINQAFWWKDDTCENIIEGYESLII